MIGSPFPMNTQRQNNSMTSIALTLFMRPELIFFPKICRATRNRPDVELFNRQQFTND